MALRTSTSTADRPPPPAGSGTLPVAAGPTSPPARRLRGPSWLDLRLVIGVVLVLGSALVGVKVIASADSSTTVWAVRTDLAAGTPLTAGDLMQVKVRLYDSADRYLSTRTSPAGRTLVSDMGAGELLPAAAVAVRSDFVSFSLAVPAQRVPVSLRRGDKVTIFASTTDVDSPVSTTQVATGVAVVEISGRSDGALSVGTSSVQVVLSVPGCAVPAILDATEKKTVSLAVLASTARVRTPSCSASGSAGETSSAAAAPSSAAPSS